MHQVRRRVVVRVGLVVPVAERGHVAFAAAARCGRTANGSAGNVASAAALVVRWRHDGRRFVFSFRPMQAVDSGVVSICWMMMMLVAIGGIIVVVRIVMRILIVRMRRVSSRIGNLRSSGRGGGGSSCCKVGGVLVLVGGCSHVLGPLEARGGRHVLRCRGHFFQGGDANLWRADV